MTTSEEQERPAATDMDNSGNIEDKVDDKPRENETEMERDVTEKDTESATENGKYYCAGAKEE